MEDVIFTVRSINLHVARKLFHSSFTFATRKMTSTQWPYSKGFSWSIDQLWSSFTRRRSCSSVGSHPPQRPSPSPSLLCLTTTTINTVKDLKKDLGCGRNDDKLLFYFTPQNRLCQRRHNTTYLSYLSFSHAFSLLFFSQTCAHEAGGGPSGALIGRIFIHFSTIPAHTHLPSYRLVMKFRLYGSQRLLQQPSFSFFFNPFLSPVQSSPQTSDGCGKTWLGVDPQAFLVDTILDFLLL